MLAYWTADVPLALSTVDEEFTPPNRIWFLFDRDGMIVRSSGHSDREREARSTLITSLIHQTVELTCMTLMAMDDDAGIESENGVLN